MHGSSWVWSGEWAHVGLGDVFDGSLGFQTLPDLPITLGNGPGVDFWNAPSSDYWSARPAPATTPVVGM